MIKGNKFPLTSPDGTSGHHDTTKSARHRVRLLPVFVVLCLALTACAPADQGVQQGDDSGAPTSKESAPASGETTARGVPTEAADDDLATRTFALPGEGVFPEGVAYDEATGNFFVGSTASGAVYRGNVEAGSDRTEVFLEGGRDGRTATTGMKVDGEGRLWISGRDTGRAYVYDAGSGDLIATFETPSSRNTLINDVAVTRKAAYFTDSFRPVIFRVPKTPDNVGEIEPWLDLEGTPIVYREGFNLNGIAASADGRYLVTVHYATGELFRVNTESQEVTRIDLDGETFPTGDGLLLDGRTLYVVQEEPAQIVPVELSQDLESGEAGEPFSDPSLRFPTTIAKHGNRLLVVNSQLNMGGGDNRPELPFTVSDIPIPPAEASRK